MRVGRKSDRKLGNSQHWYDSNNSTGNAIQCHQNNTRIQENLWLFFHWYISVPSEIYILLIWQLYVMCIPIYLLYKSTSEEMTINQTTNDTGWFCYSDKWRANVKIIFLLYLHAYGYLFKIWMFQVLTPFVIRWKMVCSK